METLISMIDGLAENGDKPAVIAMQKEGSQRWTYRDMAGFSRKLAGGLIRAGLSVGDRVAIRAAPGAEWILACLAVIRAGGVAVPLDTQLDDKLFSGIVKDCSPRWIFMDAGGSERMKEIASEAGIEPILLGGSENSPRSWRRLAADNGWEYPSVRPDDPAALFYTSGTTGPPKGVPLTHENLTFQLDALLEAGLVGDEDRMLVPLPLHHVYPLVIGMLVPLTFGIPIIFPRSLTGPEILRAVREAEATILIGVPRLYEAVFEGIESRFRSRSGIAAELFNAVAVFSGNLRQTVGLSVGKRLFKPLHDRIGPKLSITASGGAPLDPALARKLEGLGWRISVGYGLTETAPILTLDPPGKARIGSVGRPLPGVLVRIDPSAGSQTSGRRSVSGNPVGEIQAKGPNIFSGYHNMPEKTEESFTQDGWFRTGDLGYFDKDGYLYVTGRVSTLIVTASGENIQPDDLEAFYGQSPMIREIGILQKDGRLAAVVVPDPGKIGTSGREDMLDALRREIEARSRGVATFKRVSDIVISRKPLARTRLGKIKRHLLTERYDREKNREAGPEEMRPVSIQEMSAEDRQLLENQAAEKVWNLLSRRYKDRPLTPDTRLRSELGIDSMGWLNLTLDLARQAGIELDDEAIGDIETVRDLLRKAAESPDSIGAVHPEMSLFEDPERFLGRQQKTWLEPLSPGMRTAARILFLFNRFLMKKLFRLTIHGIEHLPMKPPFLLAPNHISYLDPFALSAALDFSVLRRTYWGGWTGAAFANPFNRFVSRLGQVVPIEPEKAALSSLAFSAAVLKRKKNLVWFPEGQRSFTGALQSFKPGVGLLLDRFPVPAIPVRIQGTDKSLPRGRFFKGFHPVTVVFGRPVDPREAVDRRKEERPQDRIVGELWERIALMEDSDQ